MLDLFNKLEPAISVRGMHLDLKGHQPTSSRFLEIPEMLSKMRFNTVLIEWEDTFCWQDHGLRSKNAYSKDVILEFLENCKIYNIEPIPLIQTFGHLENLLKHEKYAYLREIPDDYRDICPLKSKSLELIHGLVEEMLALHGGYIKYLHLGADEVRSLGSCDDCKKEVSRTGREELFLKHLNPIFDLVESAGVRPIIWHDMLEKVDEGILYELSAKTDIMLWEYRKTVIEEGHHVTEELLLRLKNVGAEIWGASAFKGADLLKYVAPDRDNRLANCHEWTSIACKYELKGLISTGWSRYSTCCIACESLEASWDTLLLSALTMWNGSLDDINKTKLSEGIKYFLKASLGSDALRSVTLAQDLQGLYDNCVFEMGFYLMMANTSIIGNERINPGISKELIRKLTIIGEKWSGSMAKYYDACKGYIEEVCLDEYIDSQNALFENILQRTGLDDCFKFSHEKCEGL